LLDTLLDRLLFPVQASQVDGGSEFAAEFEEACYQKELPLFVLQPKSPKFNANVERSNRTHDEEFYERTQSPIRCPCSTASYSAGREPTTACDHNSPWSTSLR
jgi:hypothetical protein